MIQLKLWRGGVYLGWSSWALDTITEKREAEAVWRRNREDKGAMRRTQRFE